MTGKKRPAARRRDMTHDIIKTWPAFMHPRKVLQIFTHPWPDFYFSVGRGHPKFSVRRMWFTHRGRILGYFEVDRIVMNDGTLPKLRSIENHESEWQFKRGVWVAICSGPFVRLKERIYYSGFRGFRYFDLDEHRGTMEARIRI